MMWLGGILLVCAIAAVINAYVSRTETRPALADMGCLVKLSSGAKLHIYEAGSVTSPTVVLLHGFGGSMHWWGGIADALSVKYHVVMLDLLGHGGSDKPIRGYSMPNQGHAVAEALRSIDVNRAVLVGHSMGGVIATAIAEAQPSLVAGLVLISTPTRARTGHRSLMARLSFVEVIGPTLRRLMTDKLIRTGLRKAFFAPETDIIDQYVNDFRRMTYRAYVACSRGSENYLKRRSLDQRLSQIAVSVLVIFGTKDRLVSTAICIPDYDKLAQANVVTLSGAAHSPMAEAPSAVFRHIDVFTEALFGGGESQIGALAGLPEPPATQYR